MKNLLLLAHFGLGVRETASAPTFWNTVNGFVSAGWRVWVVNVGTKEDTPLGAVDYGDGLYVIRFNPPFLKEARIRRIGWFFRMINVFAMRRTMLREAKKIIREHGLTSENTVVYGQDTHAVHAAKRLSEQYRMKLVTRFYGIWNMMEVKDNLQNRIKYYPKLQAYGVGADMVLMTNDGTRGDQVLKRSKNPATNVFFWRNGVDLPAPPSEPVEIRLPVSENDKVLMTLCRLHEGKRVHLAIEALAEVKKRIPETKLVICGFGAERERLEAQVKALGLEDSVFFTGQIPHDQVYEYLKRADVFLSLYSASNLGNPLFEAMRSGRAIITLDVGATNTVVENGVNGVLLPADGIDRLPEEICRLLNDEEERRRLGAGAKAFATDNFWTWDQRIAAEIREVEKLLPEEKE